MSHQNIFERNLWLALRYCRLVNDHVYFALTRQLIIVVTETPFFFPFKKENLNVSGRAFTGLLSFQLMVKQVSTSTNSLTDVPIFFSETLCSKICACAPCSYPQCGMCYIAPNSIHLQSSMPCIIPRIFTLHFSFYFIFEEAFLNSKLCHKYLWIGLYNICCMGENEFPKSIIFEGLEAFEN